ncbi:MAG: glycosyltransferase family 39 protein [Acidobacteriota bacterium]
MKTLYSENKSPVDKAARNRSLLLLFLIVTAFFIRTYGIKTHPTNFHATRQYQTALLARSFYLNTAEHKDDIARIPSVLYRNHKVKIDPRINEKLIYQMYRIAGKEDMIIPRLMSVLYWLISGFILYKIAFLLFGYTGAMISVIFYLFFPFGINVSQSIQPESLLNMFFLWSVLNIIKHFRSEENEHFYAAAMLSGFAVLIKFTIIFPLLGIIIFSGINKYGFKKYIFNWQTLWFHTIFLSIGSSFYVYNIFWNKTMQASAATIISPKLLITPFFWVGWLTQIGKVTGVIPFCIGIILFFTIRKKSMKFILSGLLTGYFFYALVFSYTTATHDYYQLVLFPIIALLLGQAGPLMEKVGKWKKTIQLFTFSLLIAGVMFSLWHQYTFIKWAHDMRPYSPAYFLVGEQGSYFPNNVPEKGIWGNAFEAGEQTGHGINNILLSRAYGNAAMYYGKFFGRVWPTREDFDLLRLRNKERLSAEELYKKRFEKVKPKFFIITDLVSWKRQPDLQKFLRENFQIFLQEKELIIFDLRKKQPL